MSCSYLSSQENNLRLHDSSLEELHRSVKTHMDHKIRFKLILFVIKWQGVSLSLSDHKLSKRNSATQAMFSI
jgi:hypothetical protein